MVLEVCTRHLIYTVTALAIVLGVPQEKNLTTFVGYFILCGLAGAGAQHLGEIFGGRKRDQ